MGWVMGTEELIFYLDEGNGGNTCTMGFGETATFSQSLELQDLPPGNCWEKPGVGHVNMGRSLLHCIFGAPQHLPLIAFHWPGLGFPPPACGPLGRGPRKILSRLISRAPHLSRSLF